MAKARGLRASMIIEHPERSRAHEGKWTEEEFMAQASMESAELFRSIKDVVARYPGILGLRPGEGNKEPTFRVTLLNWKPKFDTLLRRNPCMTRVSASLTHSFFDYIISLTFSVTPPWALIPPCRYICRSPKSVYNTSVIGSY